MNDPLLLRERQMARISPYFPFAQHGALRADDRRVVSGTVYLHTLLPCPNYVTKP
ncbi:hypothetical protein [Microvirga roseola]|uniref:hypothetical protein n=1 Tax=Microvirga roseola TaxID=2883126 RepID=UPI001E49E2E4|nr:hypothetical protein [Microvirga roseola]